MSIAIRAERVTKTYVIDHQRQGGYLALRDVLAEGTRSAWRRVRHPLQRNPDGATSREEFFALRDVSFEIAEGDRVGIIGRNGAGKSTLLKVLSRITAPTSGRIFLQGRISSLLEVGTGFHPELTGRENIFLNGAILGMRKAEILQKFDEIVDFAEVEQFLDTPVKRYSSGMYVRLAFAVAAHLEPEILIVDEVLAVGDAQFQKKCVGKMEQVGHDGRTVLFVSHNVSLVRSLCQTGLLLRAGQVQLMGGIDEVVDEYQRQFQSSENDHQFPIRSHNGTVDVLGFNWLQEGGVPTDVYAGGERLCWSVRLTLFKRPRQFNVVVALENELGQRVMALTSEPSLDPGVIPLNEEVELTGTFEGLHLASGRYTAAFGIRLNDETVLYTAQLNALTVHESKTFPGQNGIVRVESAWSVTQPSHAESALLA